VCDDSCPIASVTDAKIPVDRQPNSVVRVGQQTGAVPASGALGFGFLRAGRRCSQLSSGFMCGTRPSGCFVPGRNPMRIRDEALLGVSPVSLEGRGGTEPGDTRSMSGSQLRSYR
jgi:hypothetical protein